MKFSRMEVLILRQLLTGASNRSIALATGSSEGSINQYINRKLKAKTGAEGRVNLALWAERNPLVWNADDKPEVPRYEPGACGGLTVSVLSATGPVAALCREHNRAMERKAESLGRPASEVDR